MSSEKVISDKKINLSTLSERQAVLFLKHQQHNTNSVNNNLIEKQIKSPKEKEKQNILLDYHLYYEYKKNESLSKTPKEILLNRQQLYKQSLKEYIPIKKNIYIDRKKYSFTDDDALPCTCFPRKFTQSEAKEILNSNYKDKTEEELFGCGFKCINRIISCECIESLCKCGISCRNRKFQNQEYADVYPIKTENRGWGLCAGSLLPKGTFVIQYIGEVYSLDSEYGMKKLEEYKNNTCTYLMSLSKNEVIDPTNKGNMARFINHSCEPNCETQKWNVLGEVCVGIFTLRDIQPDEELTFDYGFNIMKTIFQRCLCGSVSCRGYLGIAIEKDKKKNGNYIICGLCKQHCKPKDSIVLCDQCKKVFHKNCTLKKGKYENENNNNNFSYKCSHCIKKDSMQKTNVFSKEKKILEDSPTFEEYYEVNDEELRKIKKNLSDLINCGARLFWDFKQEIAILGTKDKLEIKISGTTNQIENTKNLIKKIKETKTEDENNNSIIQIKIFIPKIFLRKIIGHQSRNLNMYKLNYNVEISYDSNLITDEIFPIQESTPIKISGKENNVKAVENKIKSLLYDLKVLSIYLMPIDYQIVRNHICSLKMNIDPADVRLRKRESKNERDLKHPFYYISNNNREIVIIGNQNDINKAEKIIKDFIEVQNELKNNFSLSFLFPIYFRKHLFNFANVNHDFIFNEKKAIFDIIEPEFLRRHLSVYIEGKWKEIIEVKNMLWKSVIDINGNNNENNNVISGIYRKHDIYEFEQYAFNQEHKLISKSIKNYIVDQNPQIKNWDYISNDVENLLNDNNNNNVNNNGKKSLIENFTLTCDKETKINYLLNFEPGSYKKIFNMKQDELLSNLYDSISEIYESYNESKIIENNINNDININNEKNENNNNLINSNNLNNYISNTKTFISKYEEKKVNNNINNNVDNNINNNLYSSPILNKNSIFKNNDINYNNNNNINNNNNNNNDNKNNINNIINNNNKENQNNNNNNNNNNFISHLNSTLYSNLPSTTLTTTPSFVKTEFSDDIIKNQNVSYNFSDIKQMNINININHNKSTPLINSSFYGKISSDNNINNNIDKDKKDYNKNYKVFKDYLRHKKFRSPSHSNEDDKYSNKSKHSMSHYSNNKNYHHIHYNNYNNNSNKKYYDNNYDYDKYYNNNNNYKLNEFKRDSSFIYERKKKYYDNDYYYNNKLENFSNINYNYNNNYENNNNNNKYNYHSRSRSRSYSKSCSHSYYSRSCSSYKKEYDKHRNYSNINNESRYYDYNNDYNNFRRNSSSNLLNKNNSYYYNKNKYYYDNNNIDNYYERKKRNNYYENSGGDYIYKKYPNNNINSNVSHSNSRTNSRKRRRRSEGKIYRRSSSKNNNNDFGYSYKKDEIDKIKNNK